MVNKRKWLILLLEENLAVLDSLREDIGLFPMNKDVNIGLSA